MSHVIRGLLLSKTFHSYNCDNTHKDVVTYENEHLPYKPEEGEIYVYPSIGKVQLHSKSIAKYKNDASWQYLSFMHKIKHNLCFRNTEVGVQAAIDCAKTMLEIKN